MQVFLFRHAQRDQALFGSEALLTTYGLEQAQSIAENVKNNHLLIPNKFWASPKIRAQQTLKPASDYLKIEIQIFEDLDERKSDESLEIYRLRVQNFINKITSMKSQDVIYICTHFDWINEALDLIPSDESLLEINSNWSPAQYCHFDIHDGVWKVENWGVI